MRLPGPAAASRPLLDALSEAYLEQLDVTLLGSQRGHRTSPLRLVDTRIPYISEMVICLGIHLEIRWLLPWPTVTGFGREKSQIQVFANLGIKLLLSRDLLLR